METKERVWKDPQKDPIPKGKMVLCITKQGSTHAGRLLPNGKMKIGFGNWTPNEIKAWMPIPQLDLEPNS